MKPHRPSPSNRIGPRDLLSIAMAISIVLVARSSLADHYVVPSGSMLPTVHLSDRVLVNKTAYGLRVPFTRDYVTGSGPARGDVVVLNSPDDGIVLLKRVVAIPGDEVEVQGGRIRLNGNPVPVSDGTSATEEWLGERPHPLALEPDGGPDFGPARVPEGRYLVMGDNRGNSRDGRFFGWVRREDILGRVFAIFWRDGAPSWIGL